MARAEYALKIPSGDGRLAARSTDFVAVENGTAEAIAQVSLNYMTFQEPGPIVVILADQLAPSTGIKPPTKSV